MNSTLHIKSLWILIHCEEILEKIGHLLTLPSRASLCVLPLEWHCDLSLHHVSSAIHM
jgi:hypothetical protein